MLSRDVTIRFALQTNHSSCSAEESLGAAGPGRKVFQEPRRFYLKGGEELGLEGGCRIESCPKGQSGPLFWVCAVAKRCRSQQSLHPCLSGSAAHGSPRSRNQSVPAPLLRVLFPPAGASPVPGLGCDFGQCICSFWRHQRCLCCSVSPCVSLSVSHSDLHVCFAIPLSLPREARVYPEHQWEDGGFLALGRRLWVCGFLCSPSSRRPHL